MQRKKRSNEKQSIADQSKFLVFPDEVITEIFKFSKPEFILRSFSLVCRRFFNISRGNPLWDSKIEEYFPFINIPKQNNQNRLTVFKSNYTSGKASANYPEFSHLFYALKNGEIDKLKKSSINLNIFFDIKDPAGKSLFDYALLLKQQSVLDSIYELATKSDSLWRKPLLCWAAQTNQVNEIVRLIAEGADVNQTTESNTSTYKSTPLFFATKYAHQEAMQLLLENGAKYTEDLTPLSIAARFGFLETMKMLLSAKDVDVNQTDAHGETPLYTASKNGHLEIVEALLQKNISVNQADQNGTTPLFAAAINGHLGVVNALLKKNAQIGKVNFQHIDLLGAKYNTPILELRLGETLQERIIFSKPDPSTPPYPNVVINVCMIFALENAHQFLIYERSDNKKASAIRNLIELIYKTPEKSFTDLVTVWKSAPSAHDISVNNQSIISAHQGIASGVAKTIGAPLIGLVGMFSTSHSKALEKKAKTDTETLIEDLMTHAQLWSGNSPTQETTASSSIQLKNSSSQ